ncbi:conserved hypothetical protein [Bradyrhizobium sp. STM 3843]|uniref:alpha/beta hydrolase family protein n=1 Tax=Bradyrhizobium sp. STM 3843 TaxID=551947 RepID=UPI0002403216|nr:hypothetical protein [Bradyrhizobium sp. STM 3843]CCE08883.1 conserved hypothetical protein [Bradyrhizobium sp. STM 3843]
MRSENFLNQTSSPWPGREDLSDELNRLLGSLPDGGSDIAECLATARRIDVDDEDSWCREWTRLGDHARFVAETSASCGLDSAQNYWLRAINYYEAALFPFTSSDSRQQTVLARMRACSSAFLRCADPKGAVVTIPWRADYPLQGYFLPARGEAGKAATVICFVEPGRRKEAALLKLAGHAIARGLSLLVVDLLGVETASRFDDIVGSRDLESAVASVMDYVSEREDVDETRIAILAEDWGSSFVARGIALDQRYAAAVCDAGLWDVHERAFLARRSASGHGGLVSTIGTSRVARHIMCPVLIAMHEQGWLCPKQATKLVAQMKREHPDITLKILSGEQSSADASAAANEFIFDWIAMRLGSSTGLRS